MNKGRNIAILLLCLICLSVLTFLTTLNRTNNSGVVDNVRYSLVTTLEETKEYEFYFIEDDVMKGKLISQSYKDDNGNVTTQEYSLIIEDHPYTYLVTGFEKDEALVEYFPVDEENETKKEPFELFTEDFIKSMIYGAPPVLSVTQAIIVAVIAIIGGLILGKNEDLWSYFNKDSDKEFPEWEDLKKYKVVGGCFLGFAAFLLLFFVII